MDFFTPETLEALTKVAEAVINGLFVSGLALAIYNTRRLQKAKKAGISDVEHVAAVQTAPQRKLNDPLLAHIRNELRKVQDNELKLQARIRRLEAQIWKGGLGPPVE
jgi:hypothetical protein